MTLVQPNRKAIYAHLTVDAKNGLDQLAKFHRTTLTNLLEEGAHMVIRSHLKQIHTRQYNNEQMSSIDSPW